MSTREERVLVFADTMRHCQTDPELILAISEARAKTEIIPEDFYPEYDHTPRFETEVTVTKNRSFEAVINLKKEYPEAKTAVLNFANAFEPGGGVTSGAGAQEECLCRCSTLYPVLTDPALKQGFYDFHRERHDSRASDTLIYTEDVVIFKSDTDLPELLDRKDRVKTDVMTCAAPDLRYKPHLPADYSAEMTDEELYACHLRRARHLLTAAAAKGADTLVLGAFGCGAFQNNPEVVANAYRTVLKEFTGIFRKIEFAVFCQPWAIKNYELFARILQP